MRKLIDLSNTDLNNKTVFVRVDYNVPILEGIIQDNKRIIDTFPTIKRLLNNNCKVILLTHFGRPKSHEDKQFSLQFLVKELMKGFNVPISFYDGSLKNFKDFLAKHDNPSIILFENIRFYKEEGEGNLTFAKSLSLCADLYVNDAFSASHRKHASITGIPKYLPAFAGNLLTKEVENLELYCRTPQVPSMALIGGAKISTKLAVIKSLLGKMNTISIQGAMANTFVKAQGYKIGKSLWEPEMEETAKSILMEAKKGNCKIILPIDAYVSDSIKNPNPSLKPINDLDENDMILDIGPLSLRELARELSQHKSLLWNGPLGAFEFPPYHQGTFSFAELVGKISLENHLLAVAGGGDTVSALKQSGQYKNIAYISTAGGAFLEWLANGTLPGIEALENPIHGTGKCA